ncbi:MAG: phosphoribosylformylglycinamidine synthase, partial [Nitrospirae bacterium]
MALKYLYRTPALTEAKTKELLRKFSESLEGRLKDSVKSIETEFCFYIEHTSELDDTEQDVLRWLLSETFEPERLTTETSLKPDEKQILIEVGPRMNFTTSWSTNAVSICHSCGIDKIKRIERSRRFLIILNVLLDEKDRNLLIEKLLPLIHDRMTECVYPERLKSFDTGIKPEPVYNVPLIEEGREALVRLNREMGLGLDDWDIDYYYNLFVNEIGRNPTNVECFDLGQSNSEHSRHWFFKGRLIIDGIEAKKTLMELLQEPLERNPSNSVIAFKDNSSAIRGFKIETIVPEKQDLPAPYKKQNPLYHLIFTAETHNFPTGVAPFPGAETGTGGRIRDVHATGRGSLVVAGTAAYCVGNLHIPGYPLPWEDPEFEYPSNLATPLQIEIEASNGASDYGNKFGEPIIQGYTRSFGLRL